MKINLQKIPMLRLCVAFIIGIVLGNAYPFPNYIIFFTWLILLAVYMIQQYGLGFSFKVQYPHLIDVCLALQVMVAGIWVQQNSQIFQNALQIKALHATFAQVKILYQPEQKEHSYKVLAEVSYLIQQQKKIIAPIQIWLYIEKDSLANTLTEGDECLITWQPKKIPEHHNPGAFEYATYCVQHDILFACFLKPKTWKKLQTKQHSIISWSAYMNRILREQMKSYIHNTSAKAMAEALLLGYRKNIEEQITKAYSATGIIHVVAISGMHMSIIFYTLVWPLKKIKTSTIKKGFYLLFIIGIMWLFAFITGFSASVVRAAMMFSCIGIGLLLSKSLHSGNGLCMSVFFMLVVNPNFLLDIGFQLSCAAVSGMLLFNDIKNPAWLHQIPLHSLGNLVHTTLAAQLGTLPLILYYFHQFSFSFLFANLIAIPATTVIIYGLILLLFVSPIPSIASVLGTLINCSIQILNQVVVWIYSHLPLLISHIPFDIYDALIVSLIIIWLWMFISTKKYNVLMGLLFMVCIGSTKGLYHEINKYHTKGIIFFSNKKPILSILHQGKLICFSTAAIDKNTMQYVIQPAALYYRAKPIVKTIPMGTYVLHWNHKRVLITNQCNQNFETKLTIDQCWITQSKLPDLLWLQNNLQVQDKIICNHFPSNTFQRCTDLLQKNSIEIYNIYSLGALASIQ